MQKDTIFNFSHYYKAKKIPEEMRIRLGNHFFNWKLLLKKFKLISFGKCRIVPKPKGVIYARKTSVSNENRGGFDENKLDTEAKRCFATHDEDILICVYILF